MHIDSSVLIMYSIFMTNIKPWTRAIILIDMNAFFASIEQLDNPELRHKPVAVTNGDNGSCIITCSYEARHFGIHTGMRLNEALKLCPQLIRCPSRTQRYIAISKCIMQALTNITPEIEIFSVDEAFLDITSCQKLHGHPIEIARMTQRIVWEAAKLPCSIGLSGDKTTAKYAAKLHKPNGFSVIPPWRAKALLKNIPVTELCGIGPGIAHFLARYQVHKCGDMEKIPIGLLGKRFGNLGRRIWHMCQGSDPDPVHTKKQAPKSLGHGKILPPNTRDIKTVLSYFLYMCEKVCIRLRIHGLMSSVFFIGFKTQTHGWLCEKIKLNYPTHDTLMIYKAAKNFVIQKWRCPVIQIQVTALTPSPNHQQGDLFEQIDASQEKLHHVTDDINQKFGTHSLTRARLLDCLKLTDVISFRNSDC